jgi:hypothetical protein
MQAGFRLVNHIPRGSLSTGILEKFIPRQQYGMHFDKEILSNSMIAEDIKSNSLKLGG